MKNTLPIRFAICLKNKGSEDLIVRKVYQVLPDEKAEKQGLLRIIDESGEDYLYPARYFFIHRLAAEGRTCAAAESFRCRIDTRPSSGRCGARELNRTLPSWDSKEF